ncbi:MAG TPA: hypothetical protein VGZ27_01030 [Vicinamibacterales bacterium]|jgi:mono/diheme cytochrome c family protein|nr:hypothetical protein [Vicinamibacterales bacterium]
MRTNLGGFNRSRAGIRAALLVTVGVTWRLALQAAPADVPNDVTFTRDIAAILQRSCQNCHRPDGVAPMSLVTYAEVRPYARVIKQRTSLGPHRGVMPPWYIEKNVGIQKYKNDPSLSDSEIAKIGKWVDSGAPQGDPADMPPLRHFDDLSTWAIGTPDLVVSTEEVLVKANSPDWWGEIESLPTDLAEDRYVAALQIREVNDVPSKDINGRTTVGGRFVFHHMIWSTDQGGGGGTNTAWPVHEVGRGADFFPPEAGRLLKAGEKIVPNSVHLHSNGRDTRAHLEIGFKFCPKGYQPTVKPSPSRSLGNSVDISIRPNEANQQLHAYTVLQEHTKVTSFEPHMHAPGARMCLEAIWGYNIQTLTCAGYDHNWVRGYDYADDAAPLLPKGTILHIIGYMDNSPANRNVPDPRNWQGSGNRSVANMFLDLGQGVALTDEQFQREMIKRRQSTRDDVIIGCPLCNTVQIPKGTSSQQQ